MRINIIISDGKKNEIDDFDLTKAIATSIHEVFVGNKDYIDSAIVLNFEGPGPAAHQCPDESSINMIFAIDECADKKNALTFLQTAIVKVVDGLNQAICKPKDEV
jgi:hypothetical protein